MTAGREEGFSWGVDGVGDVEEGLAFRREAETGEERFCLETLSHTTKRVTAVTEIRKAMRTSVLFIS